MLAMAVASDLFYDLFLAHAEPAKLARRFLQPGEKLLAPRSLCGENWAQKLPLPGTETMYPSLSSSW